MNKSIILLMGLLLLITACTKEVIVEKNITIDREVIKVCPSLNCPDLSCNPVKCPDCVCENEKIITKSVIAEGCSKRLNVCTIQADYYEDELLDCLKNNNTLSVENLTKRLDKCVERRDKLEDLLDDIDDLI